MSQAYMLLDASKARRMLVQLADQLERPCPGAARSLREGLEETRTVQALAQYGRPHTTWIPG
ncbi:MAG: hypothetical protein WB626_06485 [Bacteroidota bacterium]